MTESVDKKEIAYLRNLLTQRKTADDKNLLTESADDKNLLTKIESADDEKTLPARLINTTATKKFASRQPATGWRGHFKRLQ